MPKKLALLLFFAPLVAVVALATEVSPSSLNLTQGQQTTVNVSNVSGTLSLTYAAMTVAPTSLTLAVNQTATLTLSNPNGSVSVSTSDKSKVTAYLQDSWITVMGKETGNATLTIKDSMTTLRVPVVVSAANDGSIVGTTEGRLLASNCFQCHGTYGSGGFEQLLGESEAEIYEELVEYQDDPDFTTDIMAAHLQGYTDAQLRAIAKYLANP